MPTPRVLLLTGDGRRHRYVAQTLHEACGLVGVLSEVKAVIVEDKAALPPDDAAVVERHFAGRDEAERRLLGEDIAWPDVPMHREPHGGANSPESFAWVQALEPDVIVLYGTCIIKPPLLDVYGERMLNMHLGLSPYYRGSGTNFWPLVNGEPECVGATLHLAVAKVDAGPILAQVRPDAAPGDRAHELGTKTIIAGANRLPEVIRSFAEGDAVFHGQDLSQGQVYRRRDFDAQATRTMWRNFERGMVEDYLADKEARDAAFPIVG